MQITITPGIEGRRITKHLGTIRSEATTGTGRFKGSPVSPRHGLEARPVPGGPVQSGLQRRDDALGTIAVFGLNRSHEVRRQGNGTRMTVASAVEVAS